MMTYTIDIYERTIIFLQRMQGQAVEGIFRYVDMQPILEKNIIPNDKIDLNKVTFGGGAEPFFKKITFQNLNFSISSQPDRIIISMINPTGNEKEFYEVAKNFSNILVNDDLSAIGVNFNGIMKLKNPEEIIQEKIIAKLPECFNDADAASLRLVYNEEGKKAKFNISLDTGEIDLSTGRKEGILILANYHRDIKTKNLLKAKIDEFQDSLEKIPTSFDKRKESIESYFNG